MVHLDHRKPIHPPFKVDLAEIVLQKYFLLESVRRELTQILKENPMLDPRVQAGINRVRDAITNEINEIKTLVQNGTDPTEVISALDELSTSVAGISDAVQAPPPPAPGG